MEQPLPQQLEIPDNVRELSLEELTPLYEEWCRRVPKGPPQGAEFSLRLNLFKRACEYISEYNKRKGAGSMGTTIFADWTDKELEDYDNVGPGWMEPGQRASRRFYAAPSLKKPSISRADAATTWRRRQPVGRADSVASWRPRDRPAPPAYELRILPKR